MYKEMKGRTGKIAGVWISSSFVIHFLLCARTRILSNSRGELGWVGEGLHSVINIVLDNE